MCTVVNKYKESFDVYIGRGSEWGNPYVIGVHGTRTEVIEAYRKLLWQRIQQGTVTTAALVALNGKKLGCFCKPQPCHGDIIQAAVTWALKQEK